MLAVCPIRSLPALRNGGANGLCATRGLSINLTSPPSRSAGAPHRHNRRRSPRAPAGRTRHVPEFPTSNRVRIAWEFPSSLPYRGGIVSAFRLGGRNPEVDALHLAVVFQLARGALEHGAAGLQHVGVARDLERERHG